jgi:hypothetical protein
MNLESLVILVSRVSKTHDSVPLLISVFSLIVAGVAALIALVSYQRERRTATKEATDLIFQEWWSDGLHELRRYFFDEFVPKKRAKLEGKSLKDRSVEGRVIKLCYFFDRVGWLGAAGLIDVDYVLGPMQHTMRRTWMVVKPLIIIARNSMPPGEFDPVYQYGFQWLFERSSMKDKQQATLLKWRFAHPNILSKGQIKSLQSHIDRDEEEFRQKLEERLTKSGH